MSVERPDVYEARFDARLVQAKEAVWRELAAYLQRHVDADAPLLDIACDRGYFIRWAKASERWATDLRDVRASLPEDVRFVQGSGLDLVDDLPSEYFGTQFMSNYLEHLPSSDAVIDQFRVSYRLARPGGRVVVLQPNIRLVGPRYWDFIDHHVALTENSLAEAAELAGFTTERLTTRFLPYSTKGRLPADPRLVRIYLRFPPAWLLLGKQTLYVGVKNGD